MATRRVLNVGHCQADHRNIVRLILQHFDAQIDSADNAEEALAKLREGTVDLVLVNRVIDLTGAEGIDLVKEMKRDEALKQVPVMLVSNREDAQQEAMQAGAVRGFGKSALENPQTVARLRSYLDS